MNTPAKQSEQLKKEQSIESILGITKEQLDELAKSHDALTTNQWTLLLRGAMLQVIEALQTLQAQYQSLSVELNQLKGGK